LLIHIYAYLVRDLRVRFIAGVTVSL